MECVYRGIIDKGRIEKNLLTIMEDKSIDI